jgi:type IV secretion system protein VirB10
MRIACKLIVLVLAVALAGFAQEQATADKPQGLVTREQTQPKANSANVITLDAGMKIPLVLKAPVSTKNAKPGDAIYAQTNFPVVVNDKIVIPPGTYVQGKVSQVTRPGRVKGRAALLVHFTSMIFPSGYTIMLPGSVEGVPGDEHNNIKGKEGTVQGDSSKGKDASTVASTAGTGAAIGALSTHGGGKGTLIGAGAGGVLGLAQVLLSRGPDVRLETGTALEMVLERQITIDTLRAIPKS